jgi:uncharacterized protein YjiS (DUF1127 family)
MMTGQDLAAMLRTLASKWRDYRTTRDTLRELNDPGLARSVAGDLGIRDGELKEVVAGGPAASKLMKRMATEMGVDLAVLRYEEPGVVRDVSLTCSRCAAKRRCLRELDAGTAAFNARDFCPNWTTFAGLGTPLRLTRDQARA